MRSRIAIRWLERIFISTLASVLGILISPRVEGVFHPHRTVLVEAICDWRGGGPCDWRTLEELSAALGDYLSSGRIVLHLRFLGSDVTSVNRPLVFPAPSNPRPGNGPQASRALMNRVADAISLTNPRLRGTALSQSPLPEAVAIAALDATRLEVPWIFLILTNGFTVSDRWGDWECGSFPPIQTFIRELEEQEVLYPGALRGADMILIGFSAGEVPGQRCTRELSEIRQLERLWSGALIWAGAASVTFLRRIPSQPGWLPI